MIDVLAKGLGKGVDEAVIKTWFFQEGEHVTEGDDLVELATEDSTVTIPVPANGILAEVFFDVGETVQRDEVICVVDDAKGGLDEDEEEDGDEKKEDTSEDDEDDF